MAGAGDIQAGRAAISVVLDDAGVQPQLNALTSQLKAASAGLSAATMPAMSAEASAPMREFQQAAAGLAAELRDGIGTSEDYQRNLDAVAAKCLTAATPAQALGVQMAKLDEELKAGRITQAEYQSQTQALATQFAASTGPVDQLQGRMVALERDLRAGAISEADYRRELGALHREFTQAAAPVDRYQAEISTLDAQLRAGTITQDQHAAAVKRAKQALEDTQQAAQKKGGAFSSLGKQIATLAAGYISWTAILNLAGKALEFVRQETEKAKQSQDSLVDSRRRLAQVATDEDDLAAMLARADEAAMRYGVDRKKAQEVMFSARSEGWEDEFETVIQNATVVDPTAGAQVAGQVPGLFRAAGEDLGVEQALSGTLAAARQSRLDFEEIAAAMPRAAEGVALAKGSFAETASALAVLAGRTGSGEEAATKIRQFAARLAGDADLAGLGLIGGFEALAAAGEEAQDKFLGSSVELRGAFAMLSDEMPTIKQRTAELTEELARTAAGEESLIARQRRVAEADPAEQMRLARTRAAIERERANEQQFARNADREVTRDRTLARMKDAGESGIRQFAAEQAANTAAFFGAGSETTATAMDIARAVVAPGSVALEGGDTRVGALQWAEEQDAYLTEVMQRTVAEPLEQLEPGAQPPAPAVPGDVSMTEQIRQAADRARARAAAETAADPDATRGERIRDSVRTAAEEFAARMIELDELRERGTLDDGTYQRAAEKAREDRQRREESEARDPTRERGARVAETMQTAAEQFASRMAELDQLRDAGALDGETYQRAAEQARSDRQRREEAEARDPIRERGERLAEALRTAAEWLEAEVQDLDELRAKGAIDEETYQRARARASEEADRRTELEQRAAGVEDPKQSVIGAFSGWRLGGQMGTVEQTARQQLAETKRMRLATENWVEIGVRIIAKLEATHS